jgi:hypothetical protein
MLRFTSVLSLDEQRLEVDSNGWLEASSLPYVRWGKCIATSSLGPGVVVVIFSFCGFFLVELDFFFFFDGTWS